MDYYIQYGCGGENLHIFVSPLGLIYENQNFLIRQIRDMIFDALSSI